MRILLCVCDIGLILFCNKLDYEYFFWGLLEGSIERVKVKREVYFRGVYKF